MGLVTGLRNRRYRLVYILILVNLLIILLPLAGLALFRIYDNQLIRRTESELIGQAVTLREAFAELFRHEVKGEDLAKHSGAISERLLARYRKEREDNYAPLLPSLNLRRDYVLQPSGEGLIPRVAPSAVAARTGRAMLPMLKNIQRVTLVGIRIVDHRGIVVSTTRSQLNMLLTGRLEVSQALRGIPTSVLRERHSDSGYPSLSSPSRSSNLRVLVSLPIIVDERVVGAVVVSRTPTSIIKDLYQQKLAVFVFLASLVLVVILVSTIMSRTINRPLQTLVKRAKGIEAGDFDGEEQVTFAITEFSQLDRAMRQMATTLRNRAQYLQSFTRSLSHEFKTPLTSIDGALEILAEDSGSLSPEQKRKFFGMIRNESQYLNKLVGRLLSMAKADLADPKIEALDLAELVKSVCERFRTRLDISVNAAGPVPLASDAEILSTVLVQILDNALHHGGEGGRVEVSIETAPDSVSVFIQDHGPGISEANLSRIFEPFFSTASDAGGTGLGLAISKSLLQAVRGELSIESNARGTLAAIKFELDRIRNA